MGAVVGAGLTVVEPKLEDLFTVFGRKLKIDLNCVKVGTIQSVNYTNMTASIQIVFQQQLRDGTYQSIPVLTDCPIFTPQGGGFSLQFPIAVGDTAIVLFADRNIDNWFQGGGVMPPADGRLHALSDAIAIVGLNAAASPLSPTPVSSSARLVAPDGAAGVVWKNASVIVQSDAMTQVEVSSGKIAIRNATQSLYTILNTFLTAASSATTVAQIATAASAANTSLALLLKA